MGNMTEICVLNDVWDDVKNDPNKFIKIIEQGMNGIHSLHDTLKTINEYGIGCNANGIWVSHSHHNSIPQLYLSYGNEFATFGDTNFSKNVKVRKMYLEMAKRRISEEESAIAALEAKEKI